MKRWLGRKSFLAVLVALLLVLGWAGTALAATNDNNVEWDGLFRRKCPDRSGED